MVCGFISNIPEQPVILGFLYSQDDLPPIEQDAENNYKLITTPAGNRIQLYDKEGEEAITIVSHDGTMKIEINDTAGILVDNPEGDINLSCKAFTMKGPGSGSLNFSKKFSIETEEEIMVESENTLNLKSKKDILFKSGDDIKLSSPGGVLAKGKPLAAKDDMVIGIDIHKEVVPVGSGTVDVPFPNLFNGKLADKLSADVLLENRNLAVKGSIAKHETGHILWPPGIKFCEQPKDEGEINESTEPSVLVNGKQAAVLLSKTENCTDMKLPLIGTGFVLTKGVPMVSILKKILLQVDWGALQDLLASVGVSLGDVLNMICGVLGTSLENIFEEKIKNLRWIMNGKITSKNEVGDEITLYAETSIADGNKITLFVYENEYTKNSHPIVQFNTTIYNGKINQKWKILKRKNLNKIEYVFICKYKNKKSKKSNILYVDDVYRIGDTGVIVEEINLRLAGFGGNLPSDKYTKYTENVVKQFQKDYMKIKNPSGNVDSKTLEKIDNFSTIYREDLNKYICPCGICGGFGQAKNKGIYGKYKTEAYHKYEYPGIHQSLLWIVSSARFYITELLDKKYGILKISSGYRCWIDNKNKGRSSTNHMGKAVDLHIKKDGMRTKNISDIDLIRKKIFVEKIGAAYSLELANGNTKGFGWKLNKIGLEPPKWNSGSNAATTWVHVDVREFNFSNYLQDKYFIKTKTDKNFNKKLSELV